MEMKFFMYLGVHESFLSVNQIDSMFDSKVIKLPKNH